MRGQIVPCTLGGLQQQRIQLAERDRVGTQLGAFKGLQTVTWITLKNFFLCFLLSSGLLWHLVVVPAMLPPMVGCAADIYQGQFRSLVLHIALVYACSHSDMGE